MRLRGVWRLIAIGAFGLLLAGVVVFAVLRSADLSVRAQVLYTSTSESSQPTQAEQDRANRLQQESGALQEVVMPLTTGSLICGLALLFVVARRWQLRE